MGFYDGYNQSREYWGNRRSEAARAFSEYRQLNPNSNYNDYKAYVDQITGGNSYLRGAIPSDQILKSIANENAKRQQQAQMQQQLETLRQQAQLSGTVGALAQNFAVQYDNDADVEDALVGALGGNDLARQQVRSMYKNGFGPIRQRAQFSAIKDNLPLAVEILQANPDADLGSIFPEMPKQFLGSIQDGARKKIAEAEAVKQRSQLNDLIAAGKMAIDMGGTPAYSGYDPKVVELATPQLSAYKTQFDTEKTKAEADKRTQRLKAMVEEMKQDPGVIAQMSKPGFSPLTVFEDRARQYGINDLKASEAAPYIQDLQEDSVAAKEGILKTQRDAQLKAAGEEAGLRHKTAAEGIANMLAVDEKGVGAPLAQRAGAYAKGAAEAIKSLGTEFDFSNPVTAQAVIRLIDADWLEAHGADPADFMSIQNAIMADPTFRQSAVTIKAGNAARDLVIKNSSGVPSDVQTFSSWISDYRAGTASDIQEAEEKIVLPAIQKGPSPSGEAANPALIDKGIADLERLKTLAGQQFKEAATSADLWLIPGSGQFDMEQAKAVTLERINSYNAMIEKLRAAKQSIAQVKFSQNAAQNDAALAARAQAQKIQSDPATRPRAPLDQALIDIFQNQRKKGGLFAPLGSVFEQ